MINKDIYDIEKISYQKYDIYMIYERNEATMYVFGDLSVLCCEDLGNKAG